VDLARFDGQVDVVVGDEVAEAFGDAAQFESQRSLPGRLRATGGCPEGSMAEAAPVTGVCGPR